MYPEEAAHAGHAIWWQMVTLAHCDICFEVATSYSLPTFGNVKLLDSVSLMIIRHIILINNMFDRSSVNMYYKLK